MLFSSFWKRGPGPLLWGPGGVLGPLDPPPPWIRPSRLEQNEEPFSECVLSSWQKQCHIHAIQVDKK